MEALTIPQTEGGARKMVVLYQTFPAMIDELYNWIDISHAAIGAISGYFAPPDLWEEREKDYFIDDAQRSLSQERGRGHGGMVLSN